tara:strand:- start:197 stop:469 length:273 start_codon:yes stop_codon:yes gene_type:complete
VVFINLQTYKESIVITIEDTGPGVLPVNINKLFDRLYRTDAARNRQNGGAGLGLAICKNIIQAHGGSIYATHSELGGLRINISLPLKKKG